MSIDIKRTFIGREVGNKPVDPNTTFNAGMVGAYNSSGNIVVSDGTTVPAGILKWNKTSTVYGVSVDEAVVMNTDGTTPSALAHANVSSVRVRSLAGGLGTLYTLTTDYAVNTTNGTVKREASGAIASGGTVYITYTFQLSAADIASGASAPGNVGLNFNLNNDDTAGSGKIVLIQGLSTVFTDQFETSRTYAIGDQLYVAGNGLLTNAVVINKFGRVVSVPTASDPYLGVEGMFFMANS